MSSKNSKQILKMIAISEENYFKLKKLGTAGDSFNDVVTDVLQRLKQLEVTVG